MRPRKRTRTKVNRHRLAVKIEHTPLEIDSLSSRRCRTGRRTDDGHDLVTIHTTLLLLLLLPVPVCRPASSSILSYWISDTSLCSVYQYPLPGSVQFIPLCNNNGVLIPFSAEKKVVGLEEVPAMWLCVHLFAIQFCGRQFATSFNYNSASVGDCFWVSLVCLFLCVTQNINPSGLITIILFGGWGRWWWWRYIVSHSPPPWLY